MISQATLKGRIKKVRFENHDNGYVVLVFIPEKKTVPVDAVGVLPGAAPGQQLELTGFWEFNNKWGQQFKFSSVKVVRPTTAGAIEGFLGSGLIPGVGKVMAKRIVRHFGKETLDILDAEIHRLKEVVGIGPGNFRKMKKAWEKQKSTRELALFCQETGLSFTFAPKLIKNYGANAEKKVRQNPYRLALDITGIGFLTADKIAFGLGIKKDHPGRAEAGLVHVLEQAGQDGHTALPENLLLEKAAHLLNLPAENLKPAMRSASSQGLIFFDGGIMDMTLAYNGLSFQIEESLAEAIVAISKTPAVIRKFDQKKAINWIEKKLALDLAPTQKKAVIKAVREKIMVITGGPGTGKTTIIRSIMEILGVLKKTVILAAPTGRAAKQMEEATGHMASTIHRLLKYNPVKHDFEFGMKNKLAADCVIIDESSMLDQWLAYKLFSALAPHTKVILVGDVDQLPSVGPGNVLWDIIATEKIPYVRLTDIFRQDEKGLIVVNAHRINKGQKPIFPEKGELTDFYFIEEDDPKVIKELVCALVTTRLPNKFSFHPTRDIQVITPMHKGETGVHSLNVELQKRLNPDGREIVGRDKVLRVGDKVMQTVNDYDLDVFNGDIGTIVDIGERDLVVRFNGRRKKYDRKKMDDIIHAYALTVHKSQGSEYPAIVAPLSHQHFIMLQRNLLYTAVTRAKKLVVLVGSKKALFTALGNNRPAHRFTALKKRIQKKLAEGLL